MAAAVRRRGTPVTISVPDDLVTLADTVASRDYSTRTGVLRSWLILGALKSERQQTEQD